LESRTDANSGETLRVRAEVDHRGFQPCGHHLHERGRRVAESGGPLAEKPFRHAGVEQPPVFVRAQFGDSPSHVLKLRVAVGFKEAVSAVRHRFAGHGSSISVQASTVMSAYVSCGDLDD